MTLVNPSVSSTIKSIQRGLFGDGQPVNITIAPVNVSKSVVNYCGQIGGGDNVNQIYPNGLRLISSTEIQRLQNTGLQLSWEVIEYN